MSRQLIANLQRILPAGASILVTDSDGSLLTIRRHCVQSLDPERDNGCLPCINQRHFAHYQTRRHRSVANHRTAQERDARAGAALVARPVGLAAGTLLSLRSRACGLFQTSTIQAWMAGKGMVWPRQGIALWMLVMLELWLRTFVNRERYTKPTTQPKLLQRMHESQPPSQD